jgi:hypothetical protein
VDAAAKQLAGDFGWPALDEIQPAGAFGDELEDETLVAQ